MTTVVSAVDDTTKIPYVKHGDEVVSWKSVPTKWWEAEQEAVTAMQDLADQYEDHDAIAGVSVVNAETRIDGRPTSRVEIEIGHKHDPDTVAVPQTDHGVDVGMRHRPPLEYHSPTSSCNDDWCDTSQYDLPPGGSRLDNGHSATCAVEYAGQDGLDHLMCSAHAVTDCGSSTPSTEVSHEGNTIGEVVEHNSAQDWAIIENDSEGSFPRFSGEIAGHDVSVSGYVSEQALHEMRSSNETTYHRGAKTCTTEGSVDRVGIDLPYDSSCEGSGMYVELDTCTYGNDSGGPHYSIWKDRVGCKWAAILAPHKGGRDGDGNGYSVGCPAHKIAENDDISFPSPTPCGMP
ncbi:hypothetical protein [Halopiger djelfimassiliensis]|uniref:hypothetical protein n=1 Tax=Halopiger djelfimassiliensis TaxID=1293047 RepID=UPI0012B53571|nr:hypothetical protein [Halopiger djelfimassiliensis]